MTEPPERRIHSVPRGVTLTLALAVAALWLAGQSTGGAATMDVDPFRQPLGSGGATVMAIFVVVILNALFVAGETSVEALRSLLISETEAMRVVSMGSAVRRAGAGAASRIWAVPLASPSLRRKRTTLPQVLQGNLRTFPGGTLSSAIE